MGNQPSSPTAKSSTYTKTSKIADESVVHKELADRIRRLHEKYSSKTVINIVLYGIL